MKKLFVYLLVALLPATTFAGKQNDGKRSGPVSTYIKEHIMPVMQSKRQAFDVNLSATEKNELASIREELQQLHQGRRAFMRDHSEETAGENREATHGMRNENRAKMKELMEQVNIIAGHHSSQLDEIFTSLAPQQKQWKEDISKLIASKQNAEEGTSFSGNEFFHNKFGRNNMWSRTRFLLLEATNTASNSERTENTVSSSPSEKMNIFPNPAVNTFSLNLSGIPAENTLTVMDMTGKVIFEKENVQPTEYVDCNNFNNGIYFLRLSSADGDINQKLLVNH